MDATQLNNLNWHGWPPQVWTGIKWEYIKMDAITPAFTVSQYIAKALQLRDYKEAIEAKHAAELKPVKDAIELLQNTILGELQAQGLQNFKDADGNTAYQHERQTVKVESREEFLTFLLSQLTDNIFLLNQLTDNKNWIEESIPIFSMASIGALIDPVREYLAEHEQLPPGLNIETYITCKIRKG